LVDLWFKRENEKRRHLGQREHVHALERRAQPLQRDGCRCGREVGVPLRGFVVQRIGLLRGGQVGGTVQRQQHATEGGRHAC
jgi:hypothetical protein